MKRLTISSPLYEPDSISILVTDQNWQLYSNEYHGDFHTSVGDISSQNLLLFCESVNEIIFVNFGFETMLDALDTTRVALNYLSHSFAIKNYDLELPKTWIENPMTRPDAKSVLWIFGCSYSHGVGVNTNQRYAYYLEQKLNIPTVMVTKPGSSLRWSLRHLLHADLHPDDIVIWQITTFPRDSVCDNDQLLSQEIIYDEQNLYLFKLLSFEQMLFNHFSLVDYGVQYLRTKKQKFNLISIEPGKFKQQRISCLMQYTKYPEYCYTPDFIVDFGTDRLHPGPLSHKRVAESLMKGICCE